MRRIRTVAIIPTMFTLGNLVCGFFSIVVASRIQNVKQPDDFNQIVLSGSLIFVGMLFDALDGQLARLAKVTSEFGAQLDSLCDIVSFGVAPAFLLVKMCPDFDLFFEQSRDSVLFTGVQTIWVIAALFIGCVALRLARFNVETEEDDDHMHFKGLPSPAGAAWIACFTFLFRYLRDPKTIELNDGNLPLIPLAVTDLDQIIQYVLPFLAAVVALMMVSRIKYPHIVNQLVKGKKSFAQLIGIVFSAVCVMLIPVFFIPLLCTLFVGYSPLKLLYTRIRKRGQPTPVTEEGTVEDDEDDLF